MLCPFNISLHVAMLSMCIHPTSLKSLQQSTTTVSTCFTRNMIKTLQATLISLMIKWAWKTSKDLKALDSSGKKINQTTSCWNKCCKNQVFLPCCFLKVGRLSNLKVDVKSLEPWPGTKSERFETKFQSWDRRTLNQWGRDAQHLCVAVWTKTFMGRWACQQGRAWCPISLLRDGTHKTSKPARSLVIF